MHKSVGQQPIHFRWASVFCAIFFYRWFLFCVDGRIFNDPLNFMKFIRRFYAVFSALLSEFRGQFSSIFYVFFRLFIFISWFCAAFSPLIRTKCCHFFSACGYLYVLCVFGALCCSLFRMNSGFFGDRFNFMRFFRRFRSVCSGMFHRFCGRFSSIFYVIIRFFIFVPWFCTAFSPLFQMNLLRRSLFLWRVIPCLWFFTFSCFFGIFWRDFAVDSNQVPIFQFSRIFGGLLSLLAPLIVPFSAFFRHFHSAHFAFLR